MFALMIACGPCSTPPFFCPPENGAVRTVTLGVGGRNVWCDVSGIVVEDIYL